MLGYIISDKYKINVKEHEIQSFDILHKTKLNIFVVKNNTILYKNNIIINACVYGHVQVLEWFKNSGYEFKYNVMAIDYASHHGNIQVLKWFKNSSYKLKYNKWAFDNAGFYVKILIWFKNLNVKKVIKWSKPLKFIKTIKYKTKNNYIKGYNKN